MAVFDLIIFAHAAISSTMNWELCRTTCLETRFDSEIAQLASYSCEGWRREQLQAVREAARKPSR